METFKNLRTHKTAAMKISLVVICAVALLLASFIFANSQRLKAQQQQSSQEAVANHTQTLNEIKSVVTQLEQNNQINHDTTIKYLQCIVEGLITSTPEDAQATFDSCIAVSGIQPEAKP